MDNFRYVIVTFETMANVENDIASEKRQQNPSPFIKINDNFAGKRICVRNNAHNYFILSLIVLFKLLIVGVAFFLGHPVYRFFLVLVHYPATMVDQACLIFSTQSCMHIQCELEEKQETKIQC